MYGYTGSIRQGGRQRNDTSVLVVRYPAWGGIMQIVHKLVDDVAVVELKGALDYGTGDRDLQQVIDDLTARGCIRVVINLNEVSHMDTACLGLLIAAHVRFGRRRGGVHLLQTPPRIRALLSIARLEQVLVTFGTEEEAVRAFTAVGARP